VHRHVQVLRDFLVCLAWFSLQGLARPIGTNVRVIAVTDFVHVPLALGIHWPHVGLPYSSESRSSATCTTEDAGIVYLLAGINEQ
jgi:hypothetical protein